MVENFLHELKNGRSYELELLLFVAYTTYKQVQQNLRRTRDLLQKKYRPHFHQQMFNTPSHGFRMKMSGRFLLAKQTPLFVRQR